MPDRVFRSFLCLLSKAFWREPPTETFSPSAAVKFAISLSGWISFPSQHLDVSIFCILTLACGIYAAVCTEQVVDDGTRQTLRTEGYRASFDDPCRNFFQAGRRHCQFYGMRSKVIETIASSSRDILPWTNLTTSGLSRSDNYEKGNSISQLN